MSWNRLNGWIQSEKEQERVNCETKGVSCIITKKLISLQKKKVWINFYTVWRCDSITFIQQNAYQATSSLCIIIHYTNFFFIMKSLDKNRAAAHFMLSMVRHTSNLNSQCGDTFAVQNEMKSRLHDTNAAQKRRRAENEWSIKNS